MSVEEQLRAIERAIAEGRYGADLEHARSEVGRFDRLRRAIRRALQQRPDSLRGALQHLHRAGVSHEGIETVRQLLRDLPGDESRRGVERLRALAEFIEADRAALRGATPPRQLSKRGRRRYLRWYRRVVRRAGRVYSPETRSFLQRLVGPFLRAGARVPIPWIAAGVLFLLAAGLASSWLGGPSEAPRVAMQPSCDCQSIEFGLLTGAVQDICLEREAEVVRLAELDRLDLVTDNEGLLRSGEFCDASAEGPGAWPSSGKPCPSENPFCVRGRLRVAEPGNGSAS